MLGESSPKSQNQEIQMPATGIETEREASDVNIARVARLELRLKNQQEESDSRIAELEKQLFDLKVEQRLAAMKPNDPAPQPTARTDSSDPALRAEISRLQQVVATKDAEIATKDAEIASNDAIIANRDRVLKMYDGCLDGLLRHANNFRGLAAQYDQEIRGREMMRAQPATVSADTAPAPPETAGPDYHQDFGMPRGEEHRQDEGQTSHGFPSKLHDPLTPRQATADATHSTMTANAEERTGSNATSATNTADQPLQESAADPSDTTSRLQIGQEAPVLEDQTYPDRVSPDVASPVANTKRVIVDREGYEWDEELIRFNIRVDGPLPREVRAAYERGDLRTPEYNPWGTPKPRSSAPPAQQLETGDSGLISASRLDVKKRSADEEPGSKGPTKHPRST